MTVLGPPLPVRWKAFSTAVGGLLAATVWLRVTAAPVAPLPPAPPPHSVAVLTFLNDSPDSAYDYLSAGMTGDLTGVLGGIPGFAWWPAARRPRPAAVIPLPSAGVSASARCCSAASARPATDSACPRTW